MTTHETVQAARAESRERGRNSAAPAGPGTFVISLDFELYWGLHDRIPLANYRDNLLGVRQAVPAMLQMFEEFDIRATWATVGFLFFRSKQELLKSLPGKRPAYTDPKFSSYRLLDSLGSDEETDPFHYAPSLIEAILRTPGQEIGTHTFSHYYCLEEGQTEDAFEQDLQAATETARRFGVEIQSLVFPKYQVNASYLKVCRRHGIRAYRGAPRGWFYAPVPDSEDSAVRRGLRLIDSYLDISGFHVGDAVVPDRDEPCEVPASRFLRPFRSGLEWFEPLRLRRILEELETAARLGKIYHLCWHPHNFGVRLAENLGFLRRILSRFTELRGRAGMHSASMIEVADRVGR